MSQKNLEFYPFHPSDEKTHKIETELMPRLDQSQPFHVEELLDEFQDDLNASLKKYENKRFEVEGVAIYVGKDIHNKPSIQIAEKDNGKCCALTIFPNDDFYSKVNVGDKVVVRANYLVLSNWFGIVMKNSELIKVVR